MTPDFLRVSVIMKENFARKTFSRLAWAAFLVFVCLVPLAAAVSGEQALYERFVSGMVKNQPKSFICRITGNAITESLARIPADARTGQPEVCVYFQRGRAHVIRVLNVNEFFRNMFSAYQPYLAMTGAWIEARGSDWAAFSRDYEMKIAGGDAENIPARISRRGEDAGSHAIFYFARKDAGIRQVQFYNGDRLAYSVANTYSAVGNYNLPQSMTITSYREGQAYSVSSLSFSAYQINPVIRAEFFK
ncbi:MAG: hypothetical protein LBC99_01730 [Spirochaetota bacterium]|jgi:hypothetical protein|nr:hypothetical protein [Spirochaetota bacterium]